jgi:prolyl 4-hydroxylase
MRFSWLLSFLVASTGVLVQTALADGGGLLSYDAFDDASWAIKSKRVSSILTDEIPALYQQYMDDCDEAVTEFRNSDKVRPGECLRDDAQRLRMNTLQPISVKNYTDTGYKKIRAPKELYDTLWEFYQEHRDKAHIEWKSINPYHNSWFSPPTIFLANTPADGGSQALQNKIFELARPVLEEWTGQQLAPVSCYGIRLYHNGSILAPHVGKYGLRNEKLYIFTKEQTMLTTSMNHLFIMQIECLLSHRQLSM